MEPMKASEFERRSRVAFEAAIVAMQDYWRVTFEQQRKEIAKLTKERDDALAERNRLRDEKRVTA